MATFKPVLLSIGAWLQTGGYMRQSYISTTWLGITSEAILGIYPLFLYGWANDAWLQDPTHVRPSSQVLSSQHLSTGRQACVLGLQLLTPLQLLLLQLFIIYPIGQGSFSDGMPLGISGTFNFMLVSKLSITSCWYTHHMLGIASDAAYCWAMRLFYDDALHVPEEVDLLYLWRLSMVFASWKLDDVLIRAEWFEAYQTTSL